MDNTHPCNSCGQWHDLKYAEFANGSRHMFYSCPISHQRFYVKFVSGMNIPVVKSRPLVRLENHIKQTSLF